MTTDEIPLDEQQRLARAIQRLGWLVLALVPPATALAAWGWGGRMALAVAVGGLLAYLNYRWIVAVVDRLVRAQQTRPTPRSYLLLFAPLALLAAGLYVIFTRRWLSALGVLVGLLLLAAAVILELTYELIAEWRR